MASSSVIVFGPTGNVGSWVARTAQRHGAKVFLAMRKVEKPIPGLSIEQEKQGGFERVQADLSQPDSVREAVRRAGAKRAFIYLVWSMPDHMRSTIEALKEAGVELVVFLSSYTIAGAAEAVPQNEIIPYMHAQVELSLKAVYGADGGWVAVRPGYFATNTARWKDDMHDGKLPLLSPDVKFDFVAAQDMGEVSGSVLARGRRDGRQIQYVFGPQMLSQRDAAAVVAEALGISVEVEGVSAEEGLRMNLARGVPEPLAKYLVSRMGQLEDGHDTWFKPEHLAESKENVARETGRAGRTFTEWAKEHKQLLT